MMKIGDKVWYRHWDGGDYYLEYGDGPIILKAVITGRKGRKYLIRVKDEEFPVTSNRLHTSLKDCVQACLSDLKVIFKGATKSFEGFAKSLEEVDEQWKGANDE